MKTSPEGHAWLLDIWRRLWSTRSTRAHRLPQAWNGKGSGTNEQGLLVIEGYRADPPRMTPEDSPAPPYPETTPLNTFYCSARPPEDPEPGALWRPMSPDGVRAHTLRRWDGTAWIALREGV